MLEDLQIRHYSPTTIRIYLHVIAEFARHFHQPPDQLGAEHIRQYQLFLMKEKQVSLSTYHNRLAASGLEFSAVVFAAWNAVRLFVLPSPLIHRTRCLDALRGFEFERGADRVSSTSPAPISVPVYQSLLPPSACN
jgi:hypothetical protein